MQLEKTIDLEENSPYGLLPRKKYISNRRLRISFNKAYIFSQSVVTSQRYCQRQKVFGHKLRSFSDFNHIGTYSIIKPHTRDTSHLDENCLQNSQSESNASMVH